MLAQMYGKFSHVAHRASVPLARLGCNSYLYRFKTGAMINTLSVFCGSGRGTDPAFGQAARLLGRTLASRGITLVFGGSKVGLMEELSDAALEAGGQVVGVMPRFLHRKGIGHPGLTRMILVDTMHQRKMRMSELCDGIIALPGGFGTLDECFEMITWAQLGIHHKPIGLLNVQGFYDPVLAMADKMVEQGFLKLIHRNMLIVTQQVGRLLERMNQYVPPSTEKWIR